MSFSPLYSGGVVGLTSLEHYVTRDPSEHSSHNGIVTEIQSGLTSNRPGWDCLECLFGDFSI